MSSAGAALSAAAAVGPYFGWERWDADDAEPWRPLADLTDGDMIAERVEAARRVLMAMAGLGEDQLPDRPVASVTFLGLVARLVSPPLGALALGGALPLPELDQIGWRPVAGGPWPVAYRNVTALPAHGLDDPALAAAFVATTVNGLVTPVLTAFQERFRLSPRVLWGNVASALAGAAGMLADRAPEPGSTVEPGERAGRLVAAVLTLPPLAAMGTYTQPDPARSRRFLARHNCCLYYQIPGGGTCGDCVLTPPDDRLRQWNSVLSR
jgi:FhuF-like iron-sulfur protein